MQIQFTGGIRAIVLTLLAALSFPAWPAEPVPDSVIIQNATNRAVPPNPWELLETRALLFQHSQYNEAQAVAGVIERAVLLHMLGDAVESGQPLRSAMEEVSRQQPSSKDLRERVLSSVRVEIPFRQFTEVEEWEAGTGAFPYQGGGWTKRLAAGPGVIVLPVQVRYDGRAGFIEGAEALLKLTPSGSVRSIEFSVRSSLDSPPSTPLHMGPGQPFWLQASSLGFPPTVEEMNDLIRGLSDGTVRLETQILRLRVSTSQRPAEQFVTIASRGASEWPPIPAVISDSPKRLEQGPLPRATLTQQERMRTTDCSRIGDCVTAHRKTFYVSQAWVVLQTFISLVPFFLFPRRGSAMPAFRFVYGFYWLLVLGTAVLAFVDPPIGRDYRGILSVGAGFFVGMPWPFLLPDLNKILRMVVDAADADVIAVWLCIAINQVLLGLLAFWRR